MKSVTNKKQKNSLKKTRALLRLELFIRLELILRGELNFCARVFMIGNSARLKTPSSVSSLSLIKLSRVYLIKTKRLEFFTTLGISHSRPISICYTYLWDNTYFT
jgi:hypothetical protein